PPAAATPPASPAGRRGTRSARPGTARRPCAARRSRSGSTAARRGRPAARPGWGGGASGGGRRGRGGGSGGPGRAGGGGRPREGREGVGVYRVRRYIGPAGRSHHARLGGHVAAGPAALLVQVEDGAAPALVVGEVRLGVARRVLGPDQQGLLLVQLHHA